LTAIEQLTHHALVGYCICKEANRPWLHWQDKRPRHETKLLMGGNRILSKALSYSLQQVSMIARTPMRLGQMRDWATRRSCHPSNQTLRERLTACVLTLWILWWRSRWPSARKVTTTHYNTWEPARMRDHWCLCLHPCLHALSLIWNEWQYPECPGLDGWPTVSSDGHCHIHEQQNMANFESCLMQGVLYHLGESELHSTCSRPAWWSSI
jgi:hypothetical protein